jgi:hypothetical protein
VCVLVGDWLLVSPDRLRVVDFRAWTLRMTSEGRRRQRLEPVVILEAGGMTLVVDGYHWVWDFLDALHPGLPRLGVLEDMKSHKEPFRPILQELIEECESSLILVKIAEKRTENRWGCEAYEMVYIETCEEPMVPLRNKDGFALNPCEIMRKGDDYAIIADMDDLGFLVMGVCMRGASGVIRPFPARLFPNSDEAAEYLMNNRRAFEDARGSSRIYPLSVGMYSSETDKIEHQRFLHN